MLQLIFTPGTNQFGHQGIVVREGNRPEDLASYDFDVIIYSGIGMDVQEMRTANARTAPTQVNICLLARLETNVQFPLL